MRRSRQRRHGLVRHKMGGGDRHVDQPPFEATFDVPDGPQRPQPHLLVALQQLFFPGPQVVSPGVVLGQAGQLALDADERGQVGFFPVALFVEPVGVDQAMGRLVRLGDDGLPQRLAVVAGWLESEFVDTGVAFDPFAKSYDQLHRPFEERSDGLMGIPLIKALVDDFTYARRDNCNHLYLRKRLGSADTPSRPPV